MLTASMDIGGAETHILDLAENLVKMGHAVALISDGGAYIPRAESLGVRCINAPCATPSVVGARKTEEIIRRELREKKYDAVHAHTRYTALLAERVLRGESIPLTVTAHLNFSLGIKRYFSRWGDATLAVSPDIRDYLIKEYGLDGDGIITTVNGIDGERFSYGKREKKRIIHTSRLDRGRSLCARLLVACAGEILDTHPEYEIIIGGDGEEFDEIKGLADGVNLVLGREGVRMLGALTHVEEAINEGNIFVGVSRSALEGGAAGLAVILCGDEGYGGILCEKSFDRMARSNFCARGEVKSTEDRLLSDILYLIEHPSEREKNGDYLAKRIREDFSPQRMAEDALSAYDLARKRKRLCAAVIGYFGHGNLGDEETLGVIEDVARERGIDIIYPKNSGKRCGAITKIRETAKGIRDSGVVLLGGGNLLQNETSIRSLIYYCEAIKYAKRHGRRVLLLSSGLGEIRGRVWRKYAIRALQSCDFLGLRTSSDIVEYAALSSLMKNGARDAARMPDLCFTLPPCDGNKKNYLAVIVSGRGKIGEAEIATLCTRTALSPRIISIFDREDKTRAECLARSLNAPLYLVKTKDELFSLLCECRLTLSERLHGAVFSLLARTPVFLDTGPSKCEALVNEVGLIARRCGARATLFPLSEIQMHLQSSLDTSGEDFEKILAALRREVMGRLDKLI